MGTILCAVDFSEQSALALRWAGGLAVRRGGSMTVFHAVDPLLANVAHMRLGTSLVNEQAAEELRQFATQALDTLPAVPREIHTKLTVGEAAPSILQASTAEPVDVIVMGTQGLGGVQKFLLGSTAERVLRRTKIPLLMVPQMEGEKPQGDPTATLKQIVAATDFGPTSTGAVRWAALLAKEVAAGLVVAHVVAPVSVPQRWRGFVDSFDEEHLTEAHRQLSRIAHDIVDDVPDCTHVASLGRPAETIAAIAHERAAGLIVLGLASGDTTDVPRPGSVAYGVIRLARTPVLVIPPEAEPPPRRRDRTTEGAITNQSPSPQSASRARGVRP